MLMVAYLEVRVFLWQAVDEDDVGLQDSVLLIVLVDESLDHFKVLVLLHDFLRLD